MLTQKGLHTKRGVQDIGSVRNRMSVQGLTLRLEVVQLYTVTRVVGSFRDED